jgi:hypothetical protein
MERPYTAAATLAVVETALEAGAGDFPVETAAAAAFLGVTVAEADSEGADQLLSYMKATYPPVSFFKERAPARRYFSYDGVGLII